VNLAAKPDVRRRPCRVPARAPFHHPVRETARPAHRSRGRRDSLSVHSCTDIPIERRRDRWGAVARRVARARPATAWSQSARPAQQHPPPSTLSGRSLRTPRLPPPPFAPADNFGPIGRKLYHWSHWALAAAVPACVAAPEGSAVQRAADATLAVALPWHALVSLNSVVSDYVPRGAPRFLARAGALGATAAAAAGTAQLCLHGGGLSGAARRVGRGERWDGTRPVGEAQ